MEPTFFKTPSELNRWLQANHAACTELWIGFYKKDSGLGGVVYRQALDEALCFGWIDGLVRRVDEASYMQRFTPRKPRSTWSAINIARARELIAEGRMRAPGQAAFERRTEDRSRIYTHEQQQAIALSPADRRAFKKHADAWAFFAAQPPSYRRGCAWWIASAKKDETRRRRLAVLIDVSARGAYPAAVHAEEDMTSRTVAAAGMLVGLAWQGLPAQLPGDRPAANPRATRSAVLARRAMIATSQPLASAAGLQVMREGGNAVDAAVTAAAVLAVVEPTMNGIGGDLFAIVFDPKTKALTGLNASGRAGHAATPGEFAKRGVKRIPEYGPLTVTVPGVVDGWASLLKRHGTITLARALAPAIAYARDGFPVSEIIAVQWKGEEKRLASDPSAAATFLVDGRAPVPGQVFGNPRLARTLEQIASGGADAFYRGPIAAAIAKDLRARQGLIDERDLAAHRSDWVEPVSTTYRGCQVFELPFNTQGFVALEMLNILEGFDLATMGHNSAEYLHLLVEANRIAFADRAAYLADSGAVPAGTQAMLLSKDYAATRRAEIGPDRAAPSYAAGRPQGGRQAGSVDLQVGGSGDTIYLTAADGNGHVVSLIQSLYDAFGSGVVAGETGIALQNRGALFTLEPGHPNQVAPGKRPFHTLVPAMVMKDGRPWLSFGVMGGDMQPQGHVQVLLNLVEFGMNVQEAGEAARYRLTGSGVALESAIGADVRSALASRGHTVRPTGFGMWGGFQGILINPRSGVLMGGSDPRKDGLAIGF